MYIFFLILLFNICYSNSQILKYHWFCNEVKVIKLRKLFQLNCMWVKLFVISTRFIFEMSILCSAKIIIYLLREKKMCGWLFCEEKIVIFNCSNSQHSQTAMMSLLPLQSSDTFGLLFLFIYSFIAIFKWTHQFTRDIYVECRIYRLIFWFLVKILSWMLFVCITFALCETGVAIFLYVILVTSSSNIVCLVLCCVCVYFLSC